MGGVTLKVRQGFLIGVESPELVKGVRETPAVVFRSRVDASSKEDSVCVPEMEESLSVGEKSVHRGSRVRTTDGVGSGGN